MAQYKKEVNAIVEAIGGADNIQTATHCVTRLRFVLRDEGKVDQEKLESLDIVKGSFSTNGQFQVIIGQGTVDKVYKELVAETGIGEATKEDVKDAAAKNTNVFQRAVKTLADIFIPILPAIVTAGLLMGINNILTAEGIFYDGASVIDIHPQWADFAGIINLIANTAFVFLPGLIGWSAVKRFGGSELLGIVLGLMLVHPDLLNAWGYGQAQLEGEIPTWNLFGLTIEQVGYQGQVLPILFSAWILAKIEIFLRKRVPDSIQLLVVAPVALLITGFIAFAAIGPITFTIGNGITNVFTSIFAAVPLVGGFLYGLIYAPLVVTGMHHTFLAVDLQLIGTIGGTFLWPILVLSNIAQGSAALAMMFATRDEKLKGLSLSSAVSAYLGITEPAMFGVNIRYKFPFVCAIISAAIGGAFITVNGVLANSIGVGGLPGIFSIQAGFWGVFFIGMVIAFILPLVLTYLYARIRKAA
ncbi:PTS system trehalose-specific EIIBC component [Halalkalibacterium halodurans]|jgi:PTS system trehalose-specific IIC component|uniref:PTS system, trehalose-specific enzyme II, BC component n=2 Tax=Halalkalibacterium halodurans TaxID=86665 RepID=Q9KAS1_HALH5|nr:PTS system trehalose-specific EIIBC component [Halalkalibacterium halodurans]MDY7222769.1 PTS system trehalose-specific EIIBC component [Halalkalibacterium halodurans]MDY7241990.1 PTS system trehalose-specific EIIBC component [Halalkalibacterium halodurans]MED3647366.1 PTS system trehalose-specific EIIBC component [Halalkalibacterium halodurans]MED4080999.1 PTS system trehalose-specific EIIBC component [Halalkalibacterium halodurans]MED4085182.1 PTS system trehalose-specific EIIBC component